MSIDTNLELPSWRPGPTLDAVVEFLEAVKDVPPHKRVAVFDNDGTLWNERPRYVQEAFLSHSFARRIAVEPDFDPGPVARDVIERGHDSMADYPAADVIVGLNRLFDGITPAEFTALVQEFVTTEKHEDFGVPFLELRYTPMLELLGALRRRAFDSFIVTGGGTEFVRGISWSGYEITEDRVVGTSLDYVVAYEDADPKRSRPIVVRAGHRAAVPNEGEQKIIEIQQYMGRTPIFAAGNSAGDMQMLDHVFETDGPALALLIKHDDPVREYAYESVAASLETRRTIEEIAAARPWTVVSMLNDWERVFPDGITK